jgi:hypothetical protein
VLSFHAVADPHSFFSLQFDDCRCFWFHKLLNSISSSLLHTHIHCSDPFLSHSGNWSTNGR